MNVRLNIAQNTNELTDWQLEKIAKAIFSNMQGKLLNIYLFVILALPKFSFIRLWKIFIVLTNVPVSNLTEFVKFLFDSDFKKFPEKIKAGRKWLYGPKAKLSNITIDEFSFADLFYYQWSKDRNDEMALNRLVSVLYRPIVDKNNPTDVREQFSKDRLPEIAKYVSKMSLEARQAVALAFGGSRDYIASLYPNVFPKIKSKKKVPYSPFRKVIESMARSENKPFGNFYETKDANVYDFLSILDAKIKHQKDLEQKFNKK